MTRIENYLDDGANWQAQAVLAYLRACASTICDESWNQEKRRCDATIEVGRYENCREQGYVFSINYCAEQKNYAVYEHRNSDSMCVLISEGLTLNTPDVDFMWKDRGENATKFDVNKYFEYGDIMACGDYIAEDMKQFISNIINKNKNEKS